MIDCQTIPEQIVDPHENSGNRVDSQTVEIVTPALDEQIAQITPPRDDYVASNQAAVPDLPPGASDFEQNSSAVKKFNHELQSYKGDHTQDQGDPKRSEKASSVGGVKSLKSPSERGSSKQWRLTSNIYNIAFGQLKCIEESLHQAPPKHQIRVRSGQNRPIMKPQAQPLFEQQEKLQKQITQIKRDLQSLRSRKVVLKNDGKVNNTIDVVQAQTLYEYCAQMKRAGGYQQASQIVDLMQKKKHLWRLRQKHDVGVLAKPKIEEGPSPLTRQLTFGGFSEEETDHLLDENRKNLGIYNRTTSSRFGKIVNQSLDNISMKEATHEKKFEQTLEVRLQNMNFPRLPPIPNKESPSKQLIKVGKKLFSLFGVASAEQKYPLTVSKYNNCISFNAKDITILWYDTGRFYIGGYRMIKNEGQKHGKGIEYMPKRYIYDGEFRNNKKCGFGSLRYANGDSYEGQFYNGLKHGKGRLLQRNGVVYDGQWKNEKMDGFGLLELSNGDRYEGYFDSGAQQGYGILRFANGDEYKGQFVQGRFYGKGMYTWANGQVYEGDFFNGCKHGKGTWKSGKDILQDVYIGQYKNDKKCGYGKYIWKDGTMYQGQFENDQRHGVGMVTEKGKFYKGVWQNGKQAKPLEKKNKSKDLQAYYDNAKVKRQESAKRRAASSLKKTHQTRKRAESQANTLSSTARNKSALPETPYRPMQFYKKLGSTN